MDLLSRSKRRERYTWDLLESNGMTTGNTRSSKHLGSVGSSALLSDEVVSEQLSPASTWALLGNYPDAITCYTEVHRIDPTAADALVNRGNTFKEIDRVNEAIQDYVQAATIRPNMPEAHANLASAYKDSGHVETAIISYKQALRLSPDFPEATSCILYSSLYPFIVADHKIIDSVYNPFASMYFGASYLAWLSQYEGREQSYEFIVQAYLGGPENVSLQETGPFWNQFLESLTQHQDPKNYLIRLPTLVTEDSDGNVQSAAHLLDRLVKDIVTESDQFSIEEFISLLRERMNVLNLYVRQFLVGWITVLDSVPDIDMLGFLPDFLDGCLHFYAFNADYHTLNGKNVDYGRMAEILVRRAGSTDEFTRLTSITWVICLSCFSCDRKT
ncbi:Protein VAC14-like protein [Zea mays]|uniref:Protein VAC14-like protein n=1 Tax=Zea mays TaxID=4577 RepID=A0A1D6MTC7_MAIZE|nr:Protein VAC14-like protein [Zea mays]